MPKEKGRQQYLAIANESVRLTKATTGFNPIFWNSLDALGNENKLREDDSAMGRRSGMDSSPLTSQYAKVGWGDVIDTDQLTRLFHYVFGSSTPTTALGATTWNYVVNQSLSGPTCTVQYRAGIEGHRAINGWLPTKLDLEFTSDSSSYKIEGAGIVESAGTAITPTYTKRNKKLLGRHAAVSYATTKAGLASPTALQNVKSVKLSFETGSNIEDDIYLNSINPTDNTFDGWKITGVEIEVVTDTAQADTLRGFNDANTENAIKIDIHATDLAVIGTSSLRPRIVIELPPSSWKVERKLELDSRIMQTIKIDNVQEADLATVQLISSIPTI
jgi:hypothetical protein